MIKTTAVAAQDLQIGQSVKFGKDDFRTIVSFEDKWGTTYVTVDRGACRFFDIASRKWRVVA